MPSVVDRLKITRSPDQNMSSMQELSDESASFRRHFEQIRGAEHAKNQLMEASGSLHSPSSADHVSLARLGLL